MLIKLLPEQAVNHWELVKDTVERSLPPTAATGAWRMTEVLKAVSMGTLEVWVSVYAGKEGPEVDGLVLTTVMREVCSGAKNLLIYALASYVDDFVDRTSWEEGLAALKKYARGLGCERVVAFTNNVKIMRMVRLMRGSVAWQFVGFGVEED